MSNDFDIFSFCSLHLLCKLRVWEGKNELFSTKPFNWGTKGLGFAYISVSDGFTAVDGEIDLRILSSFFELTT